VEEALLVDEAVDDLVVEAFPAVVVEAFPAEVEFVVDLLEGEVVPDFTVDEPEAFEVDNAVEEEVVWVPERRLETIEDVEFVVVAP